MKIFKILLSALLFLLILWIDLPGEIRIGNVVLRPLAINARVFGLNVQKDFRTHLGLDLKGGSHLVFEADTSKLKTGDTKDAIDSARDIIERRINFFGVSEPSVTTVKAGDKYRINVDLPGNQDIHEAVSLIGSTARLTFKEVASAEAKIATNTPAFLNLTRETGLEGKHVKKTSIIFDPQTGQPQVQLTFTAEGTKLFTEITKRNVGKPVGIFIDDIPLSTPVVEQVITQDTAVITGEFTTEEAQKLSIAINSGALPVPLSLVEQRNIGPTLGAEEVKKSTTAGIVGLTMVLLFMILYYGVFGVIASLALIIYGLISFAIFRAIPVVLTLSGIAGFILSIGMAVDSNILIFERIKEERRKGLEFDTAVRLGFGRAIDAIKDANTTTILVALILFNPLNWDFLPQFGLVRGFALTLMIGVATSLFTGIVVTRRLIHFFYKQKK